MSSAGDTLRLREGLADRFGERELVPQRFRATMGDGTGAVVVPGKPNYVYVRRLGRGLIEECLNNKAAARDGLPIIAGYSHESPDVLQVLEVDWYSFSAPGAYPYATHHHEAHELHNVHGGDDVVWVQSQQIMLLLVYPTNPASMRVNVFGGWYPWASGWHYFESTLSADLTAHVPAMAANARYVLISIDGATEALQYTAGATFPMFMPPVDAENMVPAPPVGSIPIGAVYLPNGSTALDWVNLYDIRLFNQPVGGSITPGVHALLDTTVHNDTATDAPTRGSLIAGNATPAWDELVIGAAQKILKVSAGGDPEWGEPPITSISGHVRGSIFRGGIGDWEVYDAKTGGRILVGSGVDIRSMPVTQDVDLDNAGAATVVGIQARAVAAGAPVNGQVYVWNAGAAEWQAANQAGGGGSNPTFKADGVLVVTTEVDGGYVCPSSAEIAYVYLYCATPGTAGSTIVDVNKNGVTIFTVQANRPTLAWNDPDGIAKSGVPDVVALAENDKLTVDIDQIATGAADMTVVIALAASAPVGTQSIGARVYNSANINVPNAAITALTFDSERFDTDNLHSCIANTDRLTCTQAGVYVITVNIMWTLNNVGYRWVSFLLNGITRIARQRHPAAAEAEQVLATIYELSVGDYVTVDVYQTSGGAINVLTSGNDSPEFSMVKAAKHSTRSAGEWKIIKEYELAGNVPSVTFASIPQIYRSLVLKMEARTDNAAESDNVCARFNGDVGNNYDMVQIWSGGAGALGSSCERGFARVLLGVTEGANSRASCFAPSVIEFPSYARTDREKWMMDPSTGQMGNVSADADLGLMTRRCRWRSTAAITTILLYPLTGANFVTGSIFTLYGVY